MHQDVNINLNSDAVNQYGLHVLLYYKNLARSYGYDTLKKRRTRIHTYVHLWYASPKRLPTSTNQENAYRSQKRLPAFGKLTSTKNAYLLTCLPKVLWP